MPLYHKHITLPGAFPVTNQVEIKAVRDFAEHLRDDSWKVYEGFACPLVAVIVLDLHTKRVSTIKLQLDLTLVGWHFTVMHHVLCHCTADSGLIHFSKKTKYHKIPFLCSQWFEFYLSSPKCHKYVADVKICMNH